MKNTSHSLKTAFMITEISIELETSNKTENLDNHM